MLKSIEEHALNAWPALRTVQHKGWLLRFAEGYTKRSNSVNAIYDDSGEDIDSKVGYCEELYEREGMDVIFKITPFVPNGLDDCLRRRGYTIADPSSVRLLHSLQNLKKPSTDEVIIEDQLSGSWLEAMAQMSGLSDVNKSITKSLLSQSPLNQSYFTLCHQAHPVACGLAVLDGEYVGLYDIVTSEAYRNQGYGEQLILHMLHWARQNGAVKSYLLVVNHNAEALRLYDKLNFKDVYPYWYRVKRST